MNGFDTNIIEFLNEWAGEWHRFDEGVSLLAELHLLKGGVFMALLWWAWYRNGALGPNTRSYIVMALVAAVAAVGLGRLLAHTLPFRERPLHAAGFDFTQPYGADEELLSSWSSFPSDHAAMFVALVASMFFISRPLGIFAAIYAFVFILLPRLYLGLHWPTDLIAGAALGGVIAWVAMQPRVREPVDRIAFRVHGAYPELFYAGAFLLTYQIATLFVDSRSGGSFVWHTLF